MSNITRIKYTKLQKSLVLLGYNCKLDKSTHTVCRWDTLYPRKFSSIAVT